MPAPRRFSWLLLQEALCCWGWEALAGAHQRQQCAVCDAAAMVWGTSLPSGGCSDSKAPSPCFPAFLSPSASRQSRSCSEAFAVQSSPLCAGPGELVSWLRVQSCLPRFRDHSLLLTKAFPQFAPLKEANLFLFEIYKKQLNSKTVRFPLLHQNGSVMSRMSALSNSPGPLRAHTPRRPRCGHRASPAGHRAPQHTPPRATCATAAESFSLRSPSQGPFMGRDPQLLCDFNLSVPKEQEPRRSQASGSLSPAVPHRAFTGG